MKSLQLIPLVVWPVLASAGSFALHANLSVSLLLFFGVPAAYLSLLKPSSIRKSALFSFIVAVPIGIVVDYVMEHTQGWFLPSSMFGTVRLFDYVTLEQLIWLFFYVYFIVMFYEAFLERHPSNNRPYTPRLKYFVAILLVVLLVFLVILAARGSLLHISYFYLKFGLVAAGIPILFAIFWMPRLMGKLLRTATYFSTLSLIYEITALKLGQWLFPAENQFLGMIQMLGVRFPFEELFFWIMLGPLATLSYYELFDDDRR